jgi:endonuclease YncB( thermonuclease family)
MLRKRRRLGWGFALACTTVTVTVPRGSQAADPQTRVKINDEAAPVTFNDGDSFRVLGGTYNGAKARLAGYNTLESHGAVHKWGTWTEKELFVLAKMATMHARRGVWSCTTDGKTDTYGRMLLWCPDLAEELVRLGYAHVMTIDDTPGKAELLAAQKEAQQARRGLWSHGIPPFILTSIHSVEEDTTGRGTYNRLVSTDDAHSVKWKHDDRYKECEWVCNKTYVIDDAKVDEVARALATDPAVAAIVDNLSEKDLRSVVHDFARYRHINRKVEQERRIELLEHLMTYVAAGKFGPQTPRDSSCMLHVPFERRFGGGRASCLK